MRTFLFVQLAVVGLGTVFVLEKVHCHPLSESSTTASSSGGLTRKLSNAVVSGLGVAAAFNGLPTAYGVQPVGAGQLVPNNTSTTSNNTAASVHAVEHFIPTAAAAGGWQRGLNSPPQIDYGAAGTATPSAAQHLLPAALVVGGAAAALVPNAGDGSSEDEQEEGKKGKKADNTNKSRKSRKQLRLRQKEPHHA